MKNLAIVFSLVFISACATTPPIPLDEGADRIKVSRDEPGEGYKVVGLLTATDGKGCGDFGVEGNRENAITKLKNEAHALGGDYVQILNVTEPHVSGGCYDNKYIVNGTAYKRSDGTDTTSEIEGSAPAAAIETPPTTDDEEFTKKLRELKELKDEGLLSEEEFLLQKQRLLDKGI